MLKGASRNVVVVKSPDPRFEQAIFIIRPTEHAKDGMTQEDLIREARKAAKSYCRSIRPEKITARKKIPYPVVFAAAGLAVTAAGLLINGLIR